MEERQKKENGGRKGLKTRAEFKDTFGKVDEKSKAMYPLLQSCISQKRAYFTTPARLSYRLEAACQKQGLSTDQLMNFRQNSQGLITLPVPSERTERHIFFHHIHPFGK